MSPRHDETSFERSSLTQLLKETHLQLEQRRTGSDENLSKEEIKAALHVYQKLQDILPIATRTGDWTAVPSSLERSRSAFHETYQNMVKEFDQAEEQQRALLHENSAVVRPLGLESLSQVDDCFILDNSLRETTVGAPRGHTLEEKHQIVDCIANSSVDEVILGAFGSKISVDSQIAERWRILGYSFDKTWGFSSLYDFESFDHEDWWEAIDEFCDKIGNNKVTVLDGDEGKPIDYYTPPSVVKTTYSKEERELFKTAYKGFQRGAFCGKFPEEILKASESELGRIPMGLLMMCGYGIKNVILELETSLEKFDFDKHDLLERCLFLKKWAEDHLEKRGQSGRRNNRLTLDIENDDTASSPKSKPRVLFNFTDFANWKRSSSGLEEALYIIHELSSLPEAERPFGFMMEDPTCWMFPDELGRLIRMMRLTMDRAGFQAAKLLVHVHMSYGTAEANVLASMANGANGVWAALCIPGAQVGHACSTVTAVNLFRAGLTSIAEKYDLEKMTTAARKIHSICMREKCPSHQEVYGSEAFDIPYIMFSLPACRYALVMLMEKMGIKNRAVRLNELAPISALERAMVTHFGDSNTGGWDPKHCPKMYEAIINHLVTGLSRDYNTPAGLGQLYALVSRKPLPPTMIWKMMKDSEVPDYHPTILEYINRWNRLCAKFQGTSVPAVPGSNTESCMCYNVNVTVEPALIELPFDFCAADTLKNHVMESTPKVFKSYHHKLIVEEEKRLQNTANPVVNFFDQIVRLKLFITEAESLNLLPLVDDFVLQKSSDFFFGEDQDWLRQTRVSRPKVIEQMIRAHMDYYFRYYKDYGNNGVLRTLKTAARRIDENQGIISDLRGLRTGDGKILIKEVASERDEVVQITETTNAKKGLEQVKKQARERQEELSFFDYRKDSSDLLACFQQQQQTFMNRKEPLTFSGPGRDSILHHMIDDDAADKFLHRLDEIVQIAEKEKDEKGESPTESTSSYNNDDDDGDLQSIHSKDTHNDIDDDDDNEESPRTRARRRLLPPPFWKKSPKQARGRNLDESLCDAL